MKKALVIIAGAVGVEVIDVILKLMAIGGLKPDSEVLSWPVDLALHKNPGITGDMAIPLFVIIPLTAVVIFVLARWAWRNRQEKMMMAVGAGVVVIGALGNLVDRVVNGFTTDYLIFFRLSAINLSDILIVAGAILLIVYTRDNPQSTK
jgi:signal peptidase II